MQSRQVFGKNKVIVDHRTKRNCWSFEWFAESPFIRCFPIRQKILYVSSMAATFHGIRAPCFIQIDCNSTAEVPSLILRTALSPIPLVSDRWVLTYNDSRKVLHKLCQILGNVSVNYFGFPSRLQESSFLYPDKCWFCTDKIEATELPNLVPRQRIDDCFEIHILNNELCDLLSASYQNCLIEVRLRQCVFCKEPLLSWSSFGHPVRYHERQQLEVVVDHEGDLGFLFSKFGISFSETDGEDFNSSNESTIST